MSCERFREQIPECLAGRLESGVRENLIAHLEVCSACRADMAEMGVVWRGLDAMPLAEPDPAMRVRFHEVLQAYQAGMEQARSRVVVPEKRTWWMAGWWPARAVWQTALALGLLVAGGFGGRYIARPATSGPEIAQLQGQVENLRQLVSLSLLQEQSPSSRIRGAAYGSQVSRPDREVEQALLYALNHDNNVNVRLSAVDALERQAANPEIQRALVDALPMQDSALVEIGVMDVLVRSGDKAAAPALRQIAQNPQADESVRQRAAAGAQTLEGSK